MAVSADLLMALAVVMFASVVLSQSPGCNTPCTNQVDCASNADCNICRVGMCQPDGNCQSYCESDADCYGSNCHQCFNNKCASACGGRCEKNGDCDYNGTDCSFCQANLCSRGGCLSHCEVDLDCFEQGNCSYCVGYRCSAKCNSTCTTDAECNGAASGCGLCVNNTCGEGDVCGRACSNNNGCSGLCSHCNTTSGQCAEGLPCGSACITDTDCSQAPTACKLCVGNICSPRKRSIFSFLDW